MSEYKTLSPHISTSKKDVAKADDTKTEGIRLNKYLASCGISSRREAEKLILDGKIKINNIVITNLSTVVLENDSVSYLNKPVTPNKDHKLWCFYKPVGLVTTHKDPQGRPTVFDFLKNAGLKVRVMSVGRLDLNSEGLLLLTNDSNFVKKAESPQTAWKRCYRVRVFGDINAIDQELLQNGITIDGERYRPINIKISQNTSSNKNIWIEITLTEGKNREIRKILNHFGLQVNRLIRYSYGPYDLGNLKPGEWSNPIAI